MLQRVERHRGGRQAERRIAARDGSDVGVLLLPVGAGRVDQQGLDRRRSPSRPPSSCRNRRPLAVEREGVREGRDRLGGLVRSGGSFHSRSQSVGFTGWNAMSAIADGEFERGDVEVDARPVEFDGLVVAGSGKFGEG